MRRLSFLFCICFALSFASCIDREFDIAKTDSEITVGGEELVIPLGEIPNISLAELLKENEMLKPNEEGVYQISFSSFGDDPTKYENISIDGISIPAITGLSPKIDPIGFSFQQLPRSLTMAGISQNFEVDYPDINRIVTIQPIKMAEELDIQLPISGQGAISEQMLTLLKMQGYDVIKSEYASETVFNAEIQILEQLKKIDWVQFGCENHPFGAPFEIKIDLRGLQDIIGGGTLKVNIEFPEGYYLRDEQGNDFPTATHNILSREVTLQAKQKSVEFLVYLNRIDYSDHEFEEGKLKIDDHIKYSYDLNLNLGTGSYNLASMPTFSIEAAPEYKDVEVVISHFEMDKASYPINYAFDGMPNGVSVEKIAFKDTYLTLSLKGLEWFHIKDNDTGTPIPAEINISLPECMNFEQNDHIHGHVLSASVDELANGVRLKLDNIDSKANGVKQENGQILVSSNIVAEIDLHEMDGHKVLVSSLTPPQTPLVISINISDTQLNIDTENTKVTWVGDKVYDLDFGNNIPTISQSIAVPEMIASIKEIEIGKANSNGEPVKIAFNLASQNSFPVDELEVDVAINLGKKLRPTQSSLASGIIKKSDNGDYILTIKESWKPNQKSISKEVSFEALENIPEIKDGEIALNQSFPVTGSVKIKDGQNIDLSKLDSAKIDINVEIDDIEVRTFKGGVNFELKPEPMLVELGDMGDLGVDINSLSLNPVLKLNLADNPTGVALNADIAITTYDADNNKLTTIAIPTISVAGSGKTNIVLSTPRNEAKYSGEGVTFIAVDNLSQLLSKGIPAKIAVDMAVTSNKNETYTIDLLSAKDGYNINYQYEVIIPLEFDGDIDLSYETTITGLNETFASLASETQGIKVGDIGLIAEFGSTIPLTLVLSAELVNAEGTSEGISARLNIDQCCIEGYNKEVDGEKRVSKVDLEFDLGESGSLEGLRNADGVRLKFTLYGANGDVASLANTQFIDGKLKLRVRDGLTLDISELLKGKEE